jgi:hypothetical protein
LEVCSNEKSGCDERIDSWRFHNRRLWRSPGEFYEDRPLAQQDAAAQHAEAVDRLAPEVGVTLPQLRTLIDAIMTVRRDIPKEELPQNINAVRRVLQSMSLSDLRRVQSILPAVERRRKAEGVE